MEELTSYLDYGLSIILSIYLLVRMEKKIDALTQSINKLTTEKKGD